METKTPNRVSNATQTPKTVAPVISATETIQSELAPPVRNLSVDQFKTEFNITTFDVKVNPINRKRCMYADGMNVVGAVGKSYVAGTATSDLQVVEIETLEGESVYVLCKKGNAGISAWESEGSY